MGGITEKITEFIKDLLTGWITSNLDTMFTDVNTKVETIAAEVGKTPQNWNSGIFSMIKNLSDNVIVPIAGMIITFVLCYELISMIMEKNNMHDTDTFMFFKYIFKMWVAVYLVTHTFDIAMAIFDVANHVVSNAGGMITGSASIDVTEALKTLLETQIEDMGIGELLGFGLETMLVSLCLKIISVLITVILYGRMIEIYLYVSVAPIPFSTFTNREWGSIGNNYVKALLALGFQGFFMMVCVAIYAVLVNAITVADNLHTAIWSVAAYTVILCFSLFKTSSLGKINLQCTLGGNKNMAYVPVPKDFSKIKTKLALNLTKRQIICFSLAGICGVPVYLLTKAGLGTDVAATLMIIVMLPFFFFAMYEKDGFPAEKILLHIIRQKFLRPGIRVYRSKNLYDRIIEYDKLEKEGAWLEKKAKEAREARNPFHFFKKADRKK